MIFHAHTWQVMKTTYAEPVKATSFKGGNLEDLAYLVLGRTDVMIQCLYCSEVQIKVMVGKEVK